MAPRTSGSVRFNVVRVFNGTNQSGKGRSERITRALNRGVPIVHSPDIIDDTFNLYWLGEEISQIFRQFIPNANMVEFRFLDGRTNVGWTNWKYRKTARWQSLDTPVWHAFREWLLGLDDMTMRKVQIALPFPTENSHIDEILHLLRDSAPSENVRLLPIKVRFEDVGDRSVELMGRIGPLQRGGIVVGGDTVPTDNISHPGLAEHFMMPDGWQSVRWGARWKIVEKWYNDFLEYDDGPFAKPPYGIGLSILFTGKDTIDDQHLVMLRGAERVAELRLQNAQDNITAFATANRIVR